MDAGLAGYQVLIYSKENNNLGERNGREHVGEVRGRRIETGVIMAACACRLWPVLWPVVTGHLVC
jgi:hypothetical protein